jgi:NitT/TauT family transport system ATP-binding protein
MVRAVAPPLVTLRGVDKVFANQVTALCGLDLEVRAGEFLSLLGPSGCGKSTVLRLLAGLTEPSRGEMHWSVARPELAFVFQEATLMPWSDVFGNVYLPLRLTGVSKEKARPRVEQALDQVGLGGFAKAYPRQLSGGMKMRVSIARALVTRPTVLLMDEPFAALDEITRLKLNDDLSALRASIGATVVFVTHSVFESVYLSDRIVVMAARPGRAVAEITVESPTESRQEGFRLCKAYADTCVQTSRALHLAMGDEPPQMLESVPS